MTIFFFYLHRGCLPFSDTNRHKFCLCYLFDIKKDRMNVCVDLCTLNGRHPEPTPGPYSEPFPDIAASKDLCGRLLAAKDHDALVAPERRRTRLHLCRYIFEQFSRNHFKTCGGYSQDLRLFEYAKNEKRIFSKFLGVCCLYYDSDYELYELNQFESN